MKSLRNHVQLIGNLGQNPDVKEFDSGKRASFVLVTNDFYTTQDGTKKTDVQWHKAVAWGKLADVVEQYLEKGAEVIVQGRLVHRSYESTDGEKRYISEINVSELMLTRKN